MNDKQYKSRNVNAYGDTGVKEDTLANETRLTSKLSRVEQKERLIQAFGRRSKILKCG